MGGFKSSPRDIAGDATIKGNLTVDTATAGTVGAGFGDAASLNITIGKINGEIVTTILVDIEGLQESGVLKDIIGDDGETTGGAYLTQITTAVNGIVYKTEMACIEEPAGGTADIDLVSNTNQLDENAAYDSGGGDALALLPATAAWDTGMHRVSAAGLDQLDLVDAYLYLAAGAGDGSNSTYTAGKFIIKLYGASF